MLLRRTPHHQLAALGVDRHARIRRQGLQAVGKIRVWNALPVRIANQRALDRVGLETRGLSLGRGVQLAHRLGDHFVLRGRPPGDQLSAVRFDHQLGAGYEFLQAGQQDRRILNATRQVAFVSDRALDWVYLETPSTLARDIRAKLLKDLANDRVFRRLGPDLNARPVIVGHDLDLGHVGLNHLQSSLELLPLTGRGRIDDQRVLLLLGQLGSHLLDRGLDYLLVGRLGNHHQSLPLGVVRHLGVRYQALKTRHQRGRRGLVHQIEEYLRIVRSGLIGLEHLQRGANRFLVIGSGEHHQPLAGGVQGDLGTRHQALQERHGGSRFRLD